MAKENAKRTPEATDGAPDDGSDTRLDRAIDELRGVLKREPAGKSLDNEETTGGEDMSAGGESAKALMDFDSEFGAGSDDFGTTDFGAGAFDGAGLAGSAMDMLDEEAPALLSAPGSSSSPASALGTHIPDARGARVGPKADAPANLDLIMDIPIDIQIVLGTSRMPVSSLMNLSEGALIGLDRKIGEPVEIVVNGRLFGRGEITVLEGDETRFGVKLLDVVSSNIK